MKKDQIRGEVRRAASIKIELALLNAGNDGRGLPKEQRGAAMAYALSFVPEEQRKQAIAKAYEHLTNYEWDLIEAFDPAMAERRKPSDSIVPPVRIVDVGPGYMRTSV